jgi:DNA-binding transcriptional LysR family regulator
VRIDPVSLRLFVAVVDTGTIAAAAEREYIAPSAVSRRLSDLEDQLQTQLLQRSNRGIAPTAAGMELLGMARSVLNDLDDIQRQMRDFSSGERGLVRVFANLSAITEFMPGCLRSFMVRHPQVQVKLEERISSAVLQGVASNAADVGLYAHGNSQADGLVSLPYRRDELVLAVPIEHALAEREHVGIREALAYDFVGLHNGSYINQELLKAAQEQDLPFRCRMQVTSFDALALMVEAGMGIALMPRLIGERFGRLFGLRILRLDEPWAMRELRLCVRDMSNLPRAARLFVEHLRAEACR